MRWVAVLLICIVIAVGVIALTDSSKTANNAKMVNEQQITERTRITEQTKQEAQQLRTEETARVVNYVAMLAIPSVVIGLIVVLVIVLDNKMARNRMWEAQELYRLQVSRMEQERLAASQGQLYLPGDTYNTRRSIAIYNERDVIDAQAKYK